MITLQQALDGITVFATQDVISSMPNSMAKFVALMAVGSMRNNPNSFVKPYESALKSFGILSEDGNMVNEANIRAAFNEAFASMPRVSWMGFTFTAEDASKLMARLGG